MFHFLFNWKIEQYFPSLLSLEAVSTAAGGVHVVQANNSQVDVIIQDDSWQNNDYNRVSESVQSQDESSWGDKADMRVSRSVDVGSSSESDSPSAATTTPVQGERRTNQIVEMVLLAVIRILGGLSYSLILSFLNCFRLLNVFSWLNKGHIDRDFSSAGSTRMWAAVSPSRQTLLTKSQVYHIMRAGCLLTAVFCLSLCFDLLLKISKLKWMWRRVRSRIFSSDCCASTWQQPPASQDSRNFKIAWLVGIKRHLSLSVLLRQSQS